MLKVLAKDSVKYINLNFLFEDICIPFYSECIYEMKDFIVFLNKNSKMNQINWHTNQFTDPSISQCDFLLAGINENMPIVNERVELIHFVLGTLLKYKPRNFMLEIQSRDDFKVVKELLDNNELMNLYKISQLDLQEKNENKFYLVGDLVGIESIESIEGLICNDFTLEPFNTFKTPKQLKLMLRSIPYSNGREFEHFVSDFLRSIFGFIYSDSFKMKEQIQNRSKTDRKDFVIENRSTCNNEFLKSLFSLGVKLLLFDAKNYAEKLEKRNVEGFKSYIDDNINYGQFGILITRKGVSDQCRTWIIEKNKQGVTIVVLTEEDIEKMLDLTLHNQDPIRIVEDKYYDIIHQN